MRATYHDTLRVDLIETNTWLLARPLRVTFEPGLNGLEASNIMVPRGFVTDFASVPRIPLAYLAMGGIGERAAVVHDYLCTERFTTSSVAADVFGACLKADKVPWWKRVLMVRAVKWFGPRF